MQLKALFRAVVCALVVATGGACASDSDNDQAKLEELKRESSEALQALKDYSAEQRDEAIAKGKQALETIDARIDALEERTREEWNDMSASAREKREATLKTLREKRHQLAEWYGGIKHSSSEAWGEVKQGFINAYDSLSNSFGEAAGESQSDDSEDAEQ